MNEWHSFDGWPAGGARHAARRAVRADNAVRVQLLVLAAGFELQPQAARVRADSEKTGIERQRSPSLRGVAGQRWNQARALDDEIGLG